MRKATHPIRKLIGCRRRTTKGRCSSNMRWMHLSHLEVGRRYDIQKNLLLDAGASAIAAEILQQLILLRIIIAPSPIDPGNISTDVVLQLLILLTQVEHDRYMDRVASWLQLDHILHDISPTEVANAGLPHTPHQALDLDSWDDAQSYNYTGFLRAELLQIYRLFDLPHCDRIGKDGFLCIPTGSYTGNTPCNYRINPEELFLFFLTRCRKGWSILDTVNERFGGWCNRWSFAWPWMLVYLDRRYANIIGHQGLFRFRHQFPQFFAAIERELMKPKWRRDENGKVWHTPGLSCSPYRTCVLVDTTTQDTDVPYSGPDEEYSLFAPCREKNCTIFQEAVFTGYKCRHGTKLETAFMPNGLCTLYGPVSCRCHDSSGPDSLLEMSGLAPFLKYIQRGIPELTPPYGGFGDCKYGVNQETMRTYYKVYFPKEQMTEFMIICDSEMVKIRQFIELSYGKTGNIFKITKNQDEFKLGKRNPCAIELVRVCYLLININNCLHGDASSGYTKFNCHPPTLEEYLKL